MSSGQVFVKHWLPDKLISKTPIILLHDSLGSVELWKTFPEQLAKHLCRQVIAYDRIGFGQSSSLHELPSIDFIAKEACNYFPQIKQRLNLENYVLIGHSVGGAMAINIAASDIDCCTAITISAQAFVEDITLQGIKVAKENFKQPGQIKRLEKWHGSKAKWVLEAWFKIWLLPEFSSWSLEGCIGRVTCPVLAIHGDSDEFGSSAFPEYIASHVSGRSEMLLLRDCGHMPHKEKVTEVIEGIDKFLTISGCNVS